MKTASPAFDWSLLPSFLAVIEHGSLLGAARVLKQAQPTLGRHIDALEQQLGVSLFERTGRGLVPTAQARAIAEHARGMQASADALSHTLSGAEQVARGSVRLTASQVVAAFALPALLLQLREEAPDIQIEVSTSNEVKNLLRREADIAIRMVQPTQGSLIARKLGEAHVGAFAHKRYLKRAGTPTQPTDLLAHPLIGFDSDETMLLGFRRLGAEVTREHFVLRSDDHILHWEALRAGLGIGFTATWLAERDPALVRLLPELGIPPLPVWLTTHRELHGSPRIRVVFDFLAEALPATMRLGAATAVR
ncbi:MAG: LysR family transcriptional regulator [Burkholderiales bacterium]|nr:LysR family transcriptional regulator [Burkholderiales bacterium]